MTMTTLEKVKKIATALDAKKADQTTVLEVTDLTILAEYFIIASATNATHVKALCDEVEWTLKQEEILPKSIEGYAAANWIVLDYADVVVHIFHEETRNFYELERLWADGNQIPLDTLLPTSEDES